MPWDIGKTREQGAGRGGKRERRQTAEAFPGWQILFLYPIALPCAVTLACCDPEGLGLVAPPGVGGHG